MFLTEEDVFKVTSAANLRNFPTNQNTSVLATLNESEVVIAREVMAFDTTSQWIKLADGGYIWGGNLAALGENPDSDSDYAALIGSWHVSGGCNVESGDTLTVTSSTVSFGHSEYRRQPHSN